MTFTTHEWVGVCLLISGFIVFAFGSFAQPTLWEGVWIGFIACLVGWYVLKKL